MDTEPLQLAVLVISRQAGGVATGPGWAIARKKIPEFKAVDAGKSMPPRAIPLARTAVLLPFIRFLEHVGAPCERLMEAARLSPLSIGRQAGLFPLHQGLRFLERAAQSQGIENFGLLVGQRTRLTALEDLGRLISPSMTLAAALATFVRVISLFSSGERLSLGCVGDKVLFSHAFTLGQATGRRHGDLFTLMLMIDLIRLAAGPGWRPQAVWLCASEANRRQLYERVLKTVVLFGPSRWGIVFNRGLLREHLKYCPPSRLWAPDPVALLGPRAPADDFAGSLRQVITSLLPHGNPQVGAVAEVAGLSVRTLQRRLTEENCSYSRLLAQAKLGVAMQLLRQKEVKVVDVALELGYSDAANFSRAFRRWTGVSPQKSRCNASAASPAAKSAP